MPIKNNKKRGPKSFPLALLLARQSIKSTSRPQRHRLLLKSLISFLIATQHFVSNLSFFSNCNSSAAGETGDYGRKRRAAAESHRALQRGRKTVVGVRSWRRSADAIVDLVARVGAARRRLRARRHRRRPQRARDSGPRPPRPHGRLHLSSLQQQHINPGLLSRHRRSQL